MRKARLVIAIILVISCRESPERRNASSSRNTQLPSLQSPAVLGLTWGTSPDQAKSILESRRLPPASGLLPLKCAVYDELTVCELESLVVKTPTREKTISDRVTFWFVDNRLTTIEFALPLRWQHDLFVRSIAEKFGDPTKRYRVPSWDELTSCEGEVQVWDEAGARIEVRQFREGSCASGVAVVRDPEVARRIERNSRLESTQVSQQLFPSAK